MTGVIIAADEGDKKLWRTLPEILTRHLAPVCPLAILSPAEARRVKPERVIVISSGALSAPAGLVPAELAPEGLAVAVVDSASAGALERVGESGLPAITCGFSARDSLTLPSFGHDSAVLGVQRSITRLDGAVIEPQEIPLRLSGGIDSFLLMAAASVFLLTGNTEKLRDAVI